jgi:hypothetical protein
MAKDDLRAWEFFLSKIRFPFETLDDPEMITYGVKAMLFTTFAILWLLRRDASQNMTGTRHDQFHHT